MEDENLDHIYTLYCKGIYNSYFYIGRTSRNLRVRLAEHIYDSKRGKSKKCVGIKNMIKDGYIIEIELLETVKLSQPSSAESFWMNEFKKMGVNLLNSQDGDINRYEPIIDERICHKWDVKDFDDIDWVLWDNGWHKGIVNQIVFYRKGWEKLKFKYISSDWIDCQGISWEYCVKDAVACFTDGTSQRHMMLCAL